MSRLSEKGCTQVLQRALMGDPSKGKICFGCCGGGISSQMLALLDLVMMEATSSSNFTKKTSPQKFL